MGKLLKVYISLYGENLNEAREYLEYNANVELRWIGLSTNGTYLFEGFCIEREMNKLQDLKDVTVYQ